MEVMGRDIFPYFPSFHFLYSSLSFSPHFLSFFLFFVFFFSSFHIFFSFSSSFLSSFFFGYCNFLREEEDNI